MGHPAAKPRRATYADLEAVPPGQLAELIHGQLHVFPRPAPPHTRASFRLGTELDGPFDRGRGGPGGWIILPEPEIHFPDPAAPRAIHALVPDLAGWRRERMSEAPKSAAITLVPDWVCEILSPSTADHDRDHKMPLYADQGVRWAWLIETSTQTLEVYVLAEDKRWAPLPTIKATTHVRAAPFDAIELDLSVLWQW